MRKLSSTLVVLAGLFTYASAFGLDRVAWFYDIGYLVKDGASSGWIESANGLELYYFRELSRNDSYVQLYDSDRQINMRLTEDTMLLKGPGETQYRPFKNGRWDDRRVFTYTSATGEYGHFQLIGGDLFRLTTRLGTQNKTTYLRQKGRTYDVVRLLDPRANEVYVLYSDQFYKGAVDGLLFYEELGRWQ
jgi:hypothetical protein